MTDWQVTPEAEVDIEHIWDYSAATWGIDQAESYIAGLQDTIYSIARWPEMGETYEHIAADYRCFSYSRHLIFYRKLGETIEVVRILHERMDVDRHL